MNWKINLPCPHMWTKCWVNQHIMTKITLELLQINFIVKNYKLLNICNIYKLYTYLQPGIFSFYVVKYTGYGSQTTCCSWYPTTIGGWPVNCTGLLVWVDVRVSTAKFMLTCTILQLLFTCGFGNSQMVQEVDTF